jgi:hypothetical protein
MPEIDDDNGNTELAQEIEHAFATSQYPGDDRLVENPSYWEAPDVVASFKGKNWQEIPVEVLFTHRLSLPLFTPEAFRYYLPAYLIASVLHPNEVDTLTENIFSMLTPPETEGSKMERFLKRVQGFTPEQKASIRAFVKLYVDTETSYPDPDRERAMKFWEV